MVQTCCVYKCHSRLLDSQCWFMICYRFQKDKKKRKPWLKVVNRQDFRQNRQTGALIRTITSALRCWQVECYSTVRIAQDVRPGYLIFYPRFILIARGLHGKLGGGALAMQHQAGEGVLPGIRWIRDQVNSGPSELGTKWWIRDQIFSGPGEFGTKHLVNSGPNFFKVINT